MDNKEIVIGFFREGYTNKNYEYIMEYVSENYTDHSPANAKSNADAVGILKIVEEINVGRNIKRGGPAFSI